MRTALIMATELEKRLLKTGVQILFFVMSSAILNRYADYRLYFWSQTCCSW